MRVEMLPQTTQYYLPKHVFLCVVDASVVFLDLHNDKYVSLEVEETIAVISLLSIKHEYLHASAISMIKQNARSNGDKEIVKEDSRAVKIVEDLIKCKLLTTDSSGGTSIIPLALDVPPLDLSGYEFDATPDLKVGHIFKFFKACTSASLKLRFHSIEKVVRLVKNRKSRQQVTSNSDLNKIRELVEIFKILRPLFFTSKNHCFFDSLALIEFMARYEIYPTWVFGVRMGPFMAHCWVQDNNFIYNEALDQANYFAPIMAV